MEFKEFPKIPGLSKDIVITEKIDGTNACIIIEEIDELLRNNKYYINTVTAIIEYRGKTYGVGAQSRNKLITPYDDNYGFAKWVYVNSDELVKMGPGRYFGEWWGQGIQRNYGKDKKIFSLFNTNRFTATDIVSVVPVLYEGPFSEVEINKSLYTLKTYGSLAAPGFMHPEGVVVYHKAANVVFKKTLEHDDAHKGAT